MNRYLPGRAEGLYDPWYEHDSCGVGFVVNVKGVRSHSLVRQALEVLGNLQHRGAGRAAGDVQLGSRPARLRTAPSGWGSATPTGRVGFLASCPATGYAPRPRFTPAQRGAPSSSEHGPAGGARRCELPRTSAFQQAETRSHMEG